MSSEITAQFIEKFIDFGTRNLRKSLDVVHVVVATREPWKIV